MVEAFQTCVMQRQFTDMTWLNYHHLLYFWTVATEGSIVRASEVLRLAPSTISVQIKELEEQMGEALFKRQGRQLVLTESGRVAQTYADEIFSLGREMVETLQTGLSHRPTKLSIGVSDVLPKLIVYRLLESLFEMDETLHLICIEGEVEYLLSKLSIHELDVVLTDSPLAPNVPIQAYNHTLGQSDVAIFGTQKLAAQWGTDFPNNFDSAPFILPGVKSSIRRSLAAWFDRQGVHPRTVAEVEDRALMQVLGEKGRGFFAAPSILADEVYQKHGLVKLAELDGVRERFYAVTLERRIRHPIVDHFTRQAKREFVTSTDTAD